MKYIAYDAVEKFVAKRKRELKQRIRYAAAKATPNIEVRTDIPKK